MAAECTSGICADGYCCDDMCTDTCKSCNVSGNEGVCAFIPVLGDDDSPACMGNQTCNGSGMCLLDNGQSCDLGMPEACATGYCNDGPGSNDNCANPP